MWKDLDQTTKDAFVKLLGDEGKAEAYWEDVDSVNRKIEEEELVTRAQETEPDESVVDAESKVESEAEVIETTVELDDTAITEVARRVAEADSVKALFAPLMERISQLEESVQSLSEQLKERDKTEEVLRAKVAELERDEEEKFIEMVDDFPRRGKVTATYRPRTNTNDEVKVSSDEQAEAVVESWGSDGFYNS